MAWLSINQVSSIWEMEGERVFKFVTKLEFNEIISNQIEV